MHSLLPRKIEVVLCCIKIYSNGMVIVKPDFNSTKKPYVVETGGFANGTLFESQMCKTKQNQTLFCFLQETYEYIIENVSAKITEENLLRELKLHDELYTRHSNFVKSLVGNEFNTVCILIL